MSEPHEQANPGLRIPGWVGTIVVGMVILASAFGHFPGQYGSKTVVGFVAVLLPVVLLFLRNRWPVVVLAACVACFIVASVSFPLTPVSVLATAVAVYTIAATRSRRWAIVTAAAVIAVLTLTVFIGGRALLHPLTVQSIITIAFAAAIGDIVRTRREYVAAITARAERAEATREAEASRRVAEDRLRIARDLHDAVAHQIAVISLNAGVASTAIQKQPDTAREALSTIRSASRTALGEIHDLLATLRSPDETASTASVPGLARLNELVKEFGAVGLTVTIRLEGDTASLPSAVDVVAYRVIQEGLTNAQKHGQRGRAHVIVAADGHHVRVAVVNPLEPGGADSEPSPAGHGLAGISERVASVRGSVTYGQDGTSYRLEALLPIERHGEAGR
ncbi:sensor histidine kinase [Leifsonia sp. NPDC058194]|uniref:sensor histidine kinase n=1 Tax=Leifsonia sp. NPDC058194 TaxID=3346374 RepID=UPI0036D7AC75